METRDVEKSRHAFRRACTIHLPQKASLHLAWAAFEESQGRQLVNIPQSNFVTFETFVLEMLVVMILSEVLIAFLHNRVN